MSLTVVDRTDTFEQWRTKTNEIASSSGDLSSLDTTDKTSTVAAINEVLGSLNTLISGPGGTITLGTNTSGNYVATADAGSGISVAGSGTETAAITITNTDKGSSQNIFKNVTVGATTSSASSNNDTLTVAAGSNISLSLVGKTLTITGIASAANNGTITIAAGTGMSGGGSFTVDQSGPSTITVTNADRGSSQTFFKSIAVSGQTTIAADANNDTLTAVAGQVDSTVGIALTTASKTLTITHGDTSTLQGVQGVQGIASITLDTYGHVTGVTSASSSPINAQSLFVGGNQVINSSGVWVGSNSGLQGIQGIQGTQGTQGRQGIQGTQGQQGIQGIQGTQGAQGTQGTQGIQGRQGIQGTQGAQGTIGTQGAQGTIGAQGYTGTNGSQGAQGSEGPGANQTLNTNSDVTFNSVTAGSFNATSSIMYKTNISPIEGAIQLVKNLNGVTYDRRNGSRYREVGVIAEDVAQLIPSVVGYKNGRPDSVDYSRFTPILIEAMKDLVGRIEKLEAKK